MLIVIFSCCIKEALFFAESHMIQVLLKKKKQTLKMNLNLEQMKKVSEIKLFDTFYACAHELHT